MCHSIVSISGAISLNLLARIKRESQKKWVLYLRVFENCWFTTMIWLYVKFLAIKTCTVHIMMFWSNTCI